METLSGRVYPDDAALQPQEAVASSDQLCCRPSFEISGVQARRQCLQIRCSSIACEAQAVTIFRSAGMVLRVMPLSTQRGSSRGKRRP